MLRALLCLPLAIFSSSLVSGVNGETFYPPNVLQDVHELSTEAYHALVPKGVDVTGGHVIHVVKYYTSEGKKKKDKNFAASINLRAHVIAAAKKLRSTSAMVSSLDFSNSSVAALMESQGIDRSMLPLIKIVSPDGSDETYDGKPKDLASYVEAKIQKYVENNLAQMMPLLAPKQKVYKAYKKASGTPRVVLVLEPKGKSKQRKAAYEAMVALSLLFKDQMSFAYTKHRKVAKALGAGSSLPAIFLIPQGNKFADARPYPGTLSYRPLRTWLAQFAGASELMPPQSDLPAPRTVDTIPEVASQKCLEKLCISRGGVCILSLMPRGSPTLTGAETTYYLDSMKQVRRHLADRLGVTSANAIHLLSVNSSPSEAGGVGEWLEQVFGLPGVEYTRTIAWYPKKHAWSQYVGRFSPPEISKWIAAASKGKATVEPLAIAEGEVPDLPSPSDATDACSALEEDKFPDEILADDFKDRMKKKSKSGSGAKQAPPMPPSAKMRLPRPRSKAGRSYELFTPELFTTNVLESPSYWLVWFQRDGSSSEEKAAWDKAARQLKGMVQFATVPADVRADLMKEVGIEADEGNETPIRLFPAKPAKFVMGMQAGSEEEEDSEESKLESSRWLEGVAVEEKAVVDVALGLLRDHPADKVYTIDSKGANTFDAWFQTQGSGPRLILVPSKDLPEPPMLLKALSVEFAHILKFGLAKKSDEQFLAQFGVQKTPAIFIIAPQAGKNPQGGKIELAVMPYQGHMSFNAISIFLENSIRVGPAQPPPPGSDDLKDEL